MKTKTIKLSFTAVFSAMIFALTMLHVPIGIGGYVHLGDAVIYISGLLLGGPWAFLAAAVGGALADIVSGYAMYAIPTLIIKMLIVIPFVIISKKNTKLLNGLSAIFCALSGVVTVLGYFITDFIFYGKGAVAGVVPNIIQAVGSAILFIALAFMLDKVNIKNRLEGFTHD